ncbi:GNAT family N-acetyltransferase [Pedobacter sp.]|uniref:GNAT family N-acetyltransferase n=1 Tax=Pedobacter sp. TaxID=1411316 RepID=UPI003C36A043
MQEIEIKKIGVADVELLQIIARKTFSEAFSDRNSAENMQQYLNEGFTTEKLSAELKNPDSAFYFAKANGEVVGYLKLNFGEAQTDLKDPRALEIERIYVVKDFYGKKIGQLLYHKALEIANEKSVEYIWLGVWEHNTRAISFYQKNGFVEFDTHAFWLGDDKQTDRLMKLELS